MNLFFKGTSSELVHCKHVPFGREEELELLVFENSELLGDVFPLWRQVRGGAKSGIPDIIGIDRDGTVCIVEIKNGAVDESILPQVLAYAIWAEENPDSIAKMWLEKVERPADLNINFENYAVRIIVVAPTILPGTVHHMRKVTFQVDLVEINRYHMNDQIIVSVNKLDTPVPMKNRPTTSTGVYDRGWYEEEGYGKAPVDNYFAAIAAASELSERNGWPIEVKLNKRHTSFKIGNSIAFGINWANNNEQELFFKLGESKCNELAPELCGKFRYDSGWKQGNFRLESGKATVVEYEAIMAACVGRLVGD